MSEQCGSYSLVTGAGYGKPAFRVGAGLPARALDAPTLTGAPRPLPPADGQRAETVQSQRDTRRVTVSRSELRGAHDFRSVDRRLGPVVGGQPRRLRWPGCAAGNRRAPLGVGGGPPPLLNRFLIAFAVLAMLACSGCAQWANEPCVYCGVGGSPDRGPGGGER
jgi:hypothetical protein